MTKNLQHNLNNLDKKTTVNFTLLSGGEHRNIIPAEATAQADIRVLDPTEFDRIENEAKFLASTKRFYSCSKVQTTLIRGRPPLPLSEGTRDLIDQAKKYITALGVN